MNNSQTGRRKPLSFCSRMNVDNFHTQKTTIQSVRGALEILGNVNLLEQGGLKETGQTISLSHFKLANHIFSLLVERVGGSVTPQGLTLLNVTALWQAVVVY